MKKLLSIVTLIPFITIAQPDWREQPVFFGVGVGVGIGMGDRVKPERLAFGLGIGKMAHDNLRGYPMDPFTISFGAFVAGRVGKEIRERRKLKRGLK